MISSWNEWDKIKKVIVGDATYANWPVNDPVFSKESQKTTWKETPVPKGPVPQSVIDEANEDLEVLASTLKALGAEVFRPDPLNFQAHDGFYNYCPRDRLLIYGSTVIDPPMMYPCRDLETLSLDCVLKDATDIRHMPRNKNMILDAANICRLGDGISFFGYFGYRHSICRVWPYQ